MNRRTFASCICLVYLLVGFDVALVAKQKTSTVDAVAEGVLRRAKAPGGIEVLLACQALQPKVSEPRSQNPSAALTAIAKEYKHLTWSKIDKAYTVKIQLSAGQSVTSIRLPKLRLKVRTLSEATDRLLSEPAVQQRIADMKINSMPENLGFSSIGERELRDLNLPEGTLQEDFKPYCKHLRHGCMEAGSKGMQGSTHVSNFMGCQIRAGPPLDFDFSL